MKINKGPGLFSDFGWKATDLLTKDFLSHCNACPHPQVVRISGICSASFLSSVITVKQCTDFASSKVTYHYFHPHASLSGAVRLNKGLPLRLSLTLGTPNLAVGAEANFETSSKLTNYSAGITLVNHGSCATVLMGDNGDTIKASYIHCLDQSKKFAVVGEITRKFSTKEDMFTVGGSYAIDSLNLVKLKLNNRGKLGAVLQHQANEKLLVTICSDFDAKALDKSPRFGWFFHLKL